MATRKTKTSERKPRCGLCGRAPKKMTTTECCGNPICDDEHKYVMFSYARNSCSRNHGRYTLCAYHFNEGHKGDWKACSKCRKSFETEMYVWYTTNEYNFEKLADPPTYEPTRCSLCDTVIRLGVDGYSQNTKGYLCEDCTAKAFNDMPRPSRVITRPGRT